MGEIYTSAREKLRLLTSARYGARGEHPSALLVEERLKIGRR